MDLHIFSYKFYFVPYYRQKDKDNYSRMSTASKLRSKNNKSNNIQEQKNSVLNGRKALPCGNAFGGVNL